MATGDPPPQDQRALLLAQRFLLGDEIDLDQEAEGLDPEVRRGLLKLRRVLGRPDLAGEEVTGHIGRFRLLQRVGEGGMGVVWLAEQVEPIRRRVALKVIKPGLDTREVVARFEAERQALALMDHPGIAKVFEAGETPQGRPYFVMEYVAGLPITAHCDLHRLTNRQRLELFLQVCEAVQHAHQKAVLHRDLKPSNVLVSLQGGTAVPKIIDFGIAKALGQSLTDRTLLTELGALVGTPEYMSPEQAEGSSQGVDTRTDVYALGVILYELLVGALPFDSKELRRAGHEGIVRKIRDEEPPRPSLRLVSLGDRSIESAARRRVDVRALRNELRGDLDWITMRALEKDRARRYGSPAEMAADVARHLRHEPVWAGPPSASYRARKFARRHRAAVAVASVLLASLAVFSGTLAWQAGRLARERDRAVREARTAEQVTEALAGVVAQFDPRWDQASTPDGLLRAITAHLETTLVGQPDVQAQVLRKLGVVYRLNGRFDEGRRVLQASLAISRAARGADDLQALRTTEMLAWLEDDAGQTARAEALLDEVATGRTRVLGPEHPDTLEALRGLEHVRGEREGESSFP